jgi:hypothetical protein
VTAARGPGGRLPQGGVPAAGDRLLRGGAGARREATSSALQALVRLCAATSASTGGRSRWQRRLAKLEPEQARRVPDEADLLGGTCAEAAHARGALDEDAPSRQARAARKSPRLAKAWLALGELESGARTHAGLRSRRGLRPRSSIVAAAPCRVSRGSRPRMRRSTGRRSSRPYLQPADRASDPTTPRRGSRSRRPSRREARASRRSRSCVAASSRIPTISQLARRAGASAARRRPRQERPRNPTSSCSTCWSGAECCVASMAPSQ